MAHLFHLLLPIFFFTYNSVKEQSNFEVLKLFDNIVKDNFLHIWYLPYIPKILHLAIKDLFICQLSIYPLFLIQSYQMLY